MGASLDNLVESWKKQPDEQNTILLCEQLGISGQAKLVDEVGKSASVKYASNPQVLMAIARMYMDASRLGDAQGLLVSAGKMAPKNGDVYRWLGEVLLRRGDAERAAKVLERAVVLGKDDEDTVFWREQADAHVDVQKRSGASGVVEALTQVLVERGLPPPPPPSKKASPLPPAPTVPTVPSVRPATASDAEVTVIKYDPRLQAADASPSPANLKETPLEGLRRNGPPPSQPPSPFAPVGKPATGARPITVPPPTPSKASTSPKIPSRPPERADFPSFDRSLPPKRPLAEAASQVGPNNALAPREVLNALALTGVFEPGGGAAAAWDAPPKTRTRFSITLVALTALLIGAGIGFFVYMRDMRAKQADEARVLNAEITKLLRAGKVADLAATETKLSRAFDLDANSPDTALLWVRNRVLRLLEAEGESGGIDTALARARQTAVPEPELAFGRIGSFVAQGDTAGAAALVPQWDERSKKDAYFQLLAGVALERAGDLRAIDRFQLAVNLDPDLVPAQVMLARAVVLEGDRARGLELARSFRVKWPDRPEGSALVALAWARDPGRGPLPPEAALAKSHRDELPVALRAVPSAIDVLQAIDKGSQPEARTALEHALAAANTPGMATWLGMLALEFGDDALARRAALQAVAFSAIYPQARVLAARVALAGGRLDEALGAVSELDASMPEVAIVRAAVAYERVDPDGLSLAIEGLPAGVRSQPELSALARASDVLRGAAMLDPARIRALVSPEIPWGDVIALDAALDSGALPLAKELVDKLQDAKDRPAYAVRVSRYLRATDHAAEADAASRTGLSMPTARAVVERVLVLLATDKGADEARSVVAKNAPLLGTMASWVLAYIDAVGPRTAETRAKAALLEPPGPGTPLLWRIVAGLALADLGDKKRGGDLVRQLAKQAPRCPEVLVAANALKK